MKKNNTKSLNELANNPRNKFLVIVINETEFWRDDIAERAGKIEGVYLVNLKEPTHLCELAVSYPAIQVRNFIHNSEAFSEDELTEHEMIFEREYTYFKGSNVPNIKKIYNSGTFEEAEENEMANPAYC